MTERDGAGSQAGQQSQGTGAQGNQSGQQGQPSLGDQVYGAQGSGNSQQGSGTQGRQGSQSGSQSGTGEAQRLEGQREGESLADYATRLNTDLKSARQDAGRYRTQLRQFQGDDTKGDDGLTEFQRLQRQVETLSSDLVKERNDRKADRLGGALINALATAGAINPARAMRLIDVAKELELGQDGTPTADSMQGAIGKLKAEMPTIFTDVRGSGDGNAGNNGGADPNDFNAAIRARAGYR